MAVVTSLSDRLNTAGSWAPQACLLELIDAIQDGLINPSQMIIIYSEPGKSPEYMIAGPGPALEKVGMAQLFLHQYLHDMTA